MKKTLLLLLFIFVACLSSFAVAFAEDPTLSFDLSHVQMSDTPYFAIGEDLSVTFVADQGYTLPQQIGVEIGGVALSEDEYDYSNGSLYVQGAKIIDGVKITVVGVANQNTEYTENHFIESLSETDTLYGGVYYELKERITKYGVTDADITATELNYQGFDFFRSTSSTISGDGTAEVFAYYKREVYNLSATDVENGRIIISTPTVKYGETAIFEVLPSAKYSIESVTVNEGAVEISSHYELQLSQDSVISATFKANMIENVTAQGIQKTYDGIQNSIVVNGTQDGDVIEFALEEDGEYTLENAFTNVFSGTVYYKVSRDNYFDFIDSVTVTISPLVVTLPSADETEFIYNGSEQEYKITLSDYYTVENAKRTDSGKQTVKVILNDKNNYVWSTGGNEDVEFEFVILKYVVNVPTADETEFIYNGSEQEYKIAVSDYYTVENAKRTDSGKQTVKVILNDKNNYVWSTGGNEDVEFEFVILKYVVNVPIADETEFIYNGSEQEYKIALSDYYTVENAKRTDSGKQTVKVILNDKNNYVWSTGGNEDVEFEFVILKYVVTAPTADETEFIYNGSEQEYKITLSDYYTVENNLQTNAGNYTVTVTLNDKDNYLWDNDTAKDIEFDFYIAKAVYDMSGIVFESKDFVFDGENKSIFIDGSLPDGVTVSYIGNAQKEVGIYQVTATFSGDSLNYELIPDVSASMHVLFDKLDGGNENICVSTIGGFDSRAVLNVITLDNSVSRILRLKMDEKVSAVYSVEFEKNGYEPEGVEYEVKLSIPAFSKKIQVFNVTDKGVQKMDYIFKDGAIFFKTQDLGQIAVVSAKLPAWFIILSAVVVAVLLVVGITLVVFSKNKINKNVPAKSQNSSFGSERLDDESSRDEFSDDRSSRDEPSQD